MPAYDNTDVVAGTYFYKNVTRKNAINENQTYRVFVDWGDSFIEDLTIVGSPFQLRDGGLAPLGSDNADIPVLVYGQLVKNSQPTDGIGLELDSTQLPPWHYKPGINI